MRQLVILLIFGIGLSLPLQAQKLVEDYIESYQYIAVSEMERTGIPASVKLAQGLLESSWGQSELAQFSYNHFGIKCGGNWEGGTYYKVDDDLDDEGQLRESCFRVFESAEASYIAHSEFLLSNRRYEFLFDLSSTNHKAWAKGLRKAGYATDPAYPKKIINVIEKYDLSRFDYMVAEEIDLLAGNAEVEKHDNSIAAHESEAEINPEQAFMEETLDELEKPKSRNTKNSRSSKKSSKSEFDETTEKLGKDIRAFWAKATEKVGGDKEDFTKNFRKRKTKKNGQKDVEKKEVVQKHKVAKDETIAMIAHEYAMTEHDIRTRNFLAAGEEVQDGETLYIKGERKEKKPKVLKLMIAPEDEYLFDTQEKK